MITSSAPTLPNITISDSSDNESESNDVSCSLKGIIDKLNPQSRRETDLKICAAIDAMLVTKEGTPITELLGQVHNDPILALAKKFLRSKSRQVSTNPALKLLRQRLTAVKLGLHRDDLNGHDDFAHFARVNYLHRYLLAYNHTLKVDPTTQEILILHKGEYQPWSAVKPLITVSEKGTLQGQYARNGLQNEDIYSWTELKPFKSEDPALWNHQYVFEHCMWTHKDLQVTDNHSWIRLRTPEGDVYSVGDWPQDKGQRWSWVKFPLRLKAGRLMSPDISEFWRGVEVFSLKFAITKDQFEAMKAQIETDKATPSRSYHMFHRNCTSYANKIAALAGIHTPATVPVNHIITPRPLRGIVNTVHDVLPSPLKKVADVSAAVLINLFSAAMGNHLVGKPTAESTASRRPHLPPLKDLFTVPRIDHPHPVLYKLAEEVEAWRAAETKRLNNDRLPICQGLMRDDLSEEERTHLQTALEAIELEERAIPYKLPPGLKVNRNGALQ